MNKLLFSFIFPIINYLRKKKERCGTVMQQRSVLDWRYRVLSR